MKESRAFCQRVISGKYGEGVGGWLSQEVRGGYGVWKGHFKGVENFGSKVAFLVVGRRMRFWLDK